MNYKKTQETLNKLSELLTEIKVAYGYVQSATDVRNSVSTYSFKKDMEKVIMGHQANLKELEIEFKQLTREL